MAEKDNVLISTTLSKDTHAKVGKLARDAGLRIGKVYELAIRYAMTKKVFIDTLSRTELFGSDDDE